MDLGVTARRARNICNACEVGREQTKCTDDWFLGCCLKKPK